MELLGPGKIVNSVNVIFDASGSTSRDQNEAGSSGEESHAYDPDEDKISEADKDAFPDRSSSSSDESDDDDAVSVSAERERDETDEDEDWESFCPSRSQRQRTPPD